MIVGMSDETPQPKRKRWRWMIAGVLLLAGTVWWHWPRGDARFVGKWKVTELRNGLADHMGWLDLRSNGSVRCSIWQPDEFWPLNWRVVNERLLIDDAFVGMPGSAVDLINRFRWAVLRNSNQVGVTANYRLLQYSPDRMTLDYGGPGVEVTFTRISE
jgi:hypothetical protein